MNKQFAVRLLSLGGAYRLGEILSSHKLVVLTYHRVIPRDECPGGRRPPNTHFAEEFDRQMEFVAERFHVPAGNELRDFLQGNGRLPRYSLAVTFDDGYENNFTFALPILQRHGLHAIFFATSNLIGQPGRPFWFDRLDQILSAVPRTDFLKRLARLEPSMFASSEMPVHRCFKALSNTRQSKLLDSLELEFWGKDIPESCRAVHGLMSWDQVRTLAAAGMTVGSHTANHQILAAVPPVEARNELLSSRLRIELETGQPCWCFAYPNGEHQDFRLEDEHSAAGVGYSCAFTQIPGSIDHRTPRYKLPRIAIPETGDMNIFRSYVSGVQRVVRAVFPQ